MDSVNIVLNNIRQDVVGAGFDWNLWDRWSVQGNYTLARYSDDNERRFASTQISYQIARVPDVFLRCQYDVLSYAQVSNQYFSPGSFQIIRPLVDGSYDVTEKLAVRATFSLPYVVDQMKWGHGIIIGGSYKVLDRGNLNMSYFNHRIPASAPFSGQGFQLSGQWRF
jgi:hypothetical protein